jgi:hypothetical protein
VFVTRRGCWLFLGRSFPASAGSVRSELVSACALYALHPGFYSRVMALLDFGLLFASLWLGALIQGSVLFNRVALLMYRSVLCYCRSSPLVKVGFQGIEENTP